MEAIYSNKILQEIAADHSIHPIQVSQLKKELLECSSELLTRGKKSQTKDEGKPKKAELFHRLASS